jgi:hypothetical protein
VKARCFNLFSEQKAGNIKLDETIEVTPYPLLFSSNAVEINMTKWTFILAILFSSIDIMSTPANAFEQNRFLTTDAVSTDRGDNYNDISNLPTTTPSKDFRISGRKIGSRGVGGDFLLSVGSTSTMSFFPRNPTLSEKMVEHMNKVIPICVTEGVRSAGYSGTVSNINIAHYGGYVNRRVNNGRRGPRVMSMHSTGRSMDLSRIDVVVGGKKLNIPMTIGSNSGRNGRSESKFYKSFNECWKRHTARCNAKGILDCNHNRLHHDHVHISLPFCPRKRGIAGT